jgi:phosphoribosylformylglycinamidine synthase II
VSPCATHSRVRNPFARARHPHGRDQGRHRVSDTATLPTVQDALALGLTREEYELVCAKQGRPPNQVELAMYSLLWSEHCAYKHSKKLLRTLPTEGPHVAMGPGENAGAVDVGEGLVCAFKVESHNHPSAVEPFQGAATGVGGILRDIFAVGARPIAVLDSLRFGEPGTRPAGGESPVDRADGEQPPAAAGSGQQGEEGEDRVAPGSRVRYLLDHAVAGIGHYGNSIGVPTVGGEVYFEAPYEQNCLVNAMALGLAPRERLVRSAAAGVGNVVVLFGASTGRDGIGGASVLASAELGEEEDKRPTVQVGDPFEEKKLMECSLELLERGLLVSLQDLGAAGLTSSASEMASKGGVGIDIDVARVPLREGDMEPFEIMVSESQERMLCVVEPHRLDEVLALCEKWEVNGAAIGAVTANGRVRVFQGERLVGEAPVRALVDDCPLYDLRPEKPGESPYGAPQALLPPHSSPRESLVALLSCPNIASRRPLFERYDAIVQSRTVRRPEQADAAVLTIEPHRARAENAPLPAIAVSIDCNGRRVAADPYAGTVAAVLECASNLACVGAEPLGTTNNLNFGNPSKPHIAWQFTEAVRGLGDACRALQAPVVGGNVSLYNEGAIAGPIYPTPVIGMVGRLPDARRAGRLGFARAGEAIALVGPFAPSLDASELAKLWGWALSDGLAEIDVSAVIAAQAAVREAVRTGAVSSAHDIAEGGLAVALAECCLAGGVGASVELDAALLMGEGRGDAAARAKRASDDTRIEGPHVAAGEAKRAAGDAADPSIQALFGEAPGGFVVSGEKMALVALAERTAVQPIGTVGGESLSIASDSERIEVSLTELADAHSAFGGLFA